jgi:hypothetical protein
LVQRVSGAAELPVVYTTLIVCVSPVPPSLMPVMPNSTPGAGVVTRVVLVMLPRPGAVVSRVMELVTAVLTLPCASRTNNDTDLRPSPSERV